MRTRKILIPIILISLIFTCLMIVPLSNTTSPAPILQAPPQETEPHVPTEVQVTDPQETIPVTEPEPTEPNIVYKHAVEDYLLPFDEYSWKREFKPELIMIHFTSGVVKHRDDPYNIEYVRDAFVENKVSIHYVIERDGTVRCYIPENRVAWHAGKGEYMKDPRYTNNINQYAIGIELVAIGSKKDMAVYLTNEEYNSLDKSLIGFTEEQYDALELLVMDLCVRYKIPLNNSYIIGHSTYSDTKRDPGELFDWSEILAGVG